jgi:hypothetical protein
VFTLQHDVREFVPITSKGRVIFFTRLTLASRALSLDDDESVRALVLPPLSREGAYFHDLDELMSLISTGRVDESAVIINFLNALDDFLVAIGVTMPVALHAYIKPFADHLTFNREYGAFFESGQSNRIGVADAVRWGIGAVVASSLWLAD